jgi:hypothetical protein
MTLSLSTAYEQVEKYCASVGDYPTDSMMHRLARFWWACRADLIMIRDVNGDTVPLHPNEAQARLHATMMGQAAAGKPVRVVILKSRKRGISTWVQALGVWLVAGWPNQQCKTLAHTSDATRDIFGIARHIAAHLQPAFPIKTGINQVECADHNSSYHCYSAGGEAVGAGGTPTLLHRSELAFWPNSTKDETDKSSGESVPYVPNTIIVDESTAKGRELFAQRFFDAQSDPEHPFEALFLPWWTNDDNRLLVEAPLTLDEDEQFIMRRAHAVGIELAHEALQWRRMKIKEIGLPDFRQQHPSTPEEAIMGSQGLIITGLRDCLIKPDQLPFNLEAMPTNERVGGIDFGYDPDPCVIGTGYYHERNLYITRIWRAFKALHAEQVRGLVPFHTYYCDPAGHSDIRNLADAASRAGVTCQVVRSPRRQFPKEDVVNTELKLVTRMIREQRLWITVGEDGKCPIGVAQLLLEADNYAWNEKTGRPDDTRNPGVWDHFDTLDMLRYLVMGVMQDDLVVKPKPRQPMMTRRQAMHEAM